MHGGAPCAVGGPLAAAGTPSDASGALALERLAANRSKDDPLLALTDTPKSLQMPTSDSKPIRESILSADASFAAAGRRAAARRVLGVPLAAQGRLRAAGGVGTPLAPIGVPTSEELWHNKW